MLVSLAACSDQSNPDPTFLELNAPFLSIAESRALADTDPAIFLAQAEHMGSDRLIKVSSEFLKLVFADSTISATDRESLLPVYARVTSALTNLGHCPEFQAELDYFQDMDPGQASRVLALAQKQKDFFASPDLAPKHRLEQLIVVHDQIISAQYSLAVSEGWDFRATLATRTGQLPLAREMFTQRLAHSRKWNLRVSRCGSIASLIMQGFMEGNNDSTSILLQRGLALARESRLGTQTGRLLALTGYREFKQGHYSSSVQFFEDAIAACRNFGSPATSLAHLGTLMRLYAVMESWAMVDRISPRAEIILTEVLEVEGSDISTTLQTIRLEEIQARSLMSRGRVNEANAAYSALWIKILAQPFEEASFVANFWIMGLLDHQRPNLAASALVLANNYAEDAGIGHMQVRIPFWKARTFFQLGEIDSALVQLDRFATEGLTMVHTNPDLQIPYYALRVRLLDAVGDDSGEAAATLSTGMNALTNRLADNDAGAGAFMDLSRARGLRWAAHDLLGRDPETGYGLELIWRRFLGVLGNKIEKPFTDQADLRAEAQRASRHAIKELARLDATHLLFQIREPQVIRWTVGNGSVKQDTLSITVNELRKIVGSTVKEMATDPGDPDATIDQSLAASLGDLARLLLPDFLLHSNKGPATSLLLISGEGFLSQIPFAPLNIATDGSYVPLTQHLNISWLRNPSQAKSQPNENRGLLIAEPEIDPILTRRYRSLGPLAGAQLESEAVLNIFPMKTLTRAEATKEAVVKEMSAASMIYFLGHVIHNPEVPFLTTIPLTPPNETHLPHEAALDIGDIRGADLSGCRLAVLSGCGSGAPFADGVITAPSLGDAFLDAGAGAAMQTFWNIRDRNPVFQPAEVLRLWEKESLSLPTALSQVRRSAMTGPEGIRHPFGWGAWSLKMNNFPE